MAAMTFPVRREALTAMWIPANEVVRRTSYWTGTPEFFFAKEIDNSRLVKVADRKRNREMAMLAAAMSIFFLLVMTYAWQHFSSVEYGYKIEALKAQRDNVSELNRALRLEQASLRDPERIDMLARRMGLSSPEAGQVMRLDPVMNDGGTAAMAQASQIAVVTLSQ